MFLQTELIRILAASRARAILSILSISLGAASLIAMVSLTQGYGQRLEELNYGAAANRIAVSENFYVQDRYPAPTIDDWKEIVRRHGRSLAGSFVRASSTYTARTGFDQYSGPLYGVMGDYGFDIRLAFYRGRNFTAEEQASTDRVCILGYDAARELFGTRTMLDKSLRLNGAFCKVIGVLQRSVGRASYVNKAIFMPFWGYQRVTFDQRTNAKSVDVIEFFVADERLRQDMVSQIDEIMRKRHGAPPAGVAPFLVGDTLGTAEAVSEQRRVATIFVLCLGGVSLVTGVIGVANAMLASVAERRREIGIRMAIGATPLDIGLQFLAESIVIASIGVLVGLVVGISAAAVIGALFEWPFAINWQVLLLGVGAAFLSGISAGLYPATRAAQCPPAEVIRMTS